MKLKNFKPRPMRQVEYYGVTISIPADHEWVATGDDGVVDSYSTKPEELNGMWVIPHRYGAEAVRIGSFTLSGEPGAIETLRHYPIEGEMTDEHQLGLAEAQLLGKEPAVRTVDWYGRKLDVPLWANYLTFGPLTGGQHDLVYPLVAHEVKPTYYTERERDHAQWASSGKQQTLMYLLTAPVKPENSLRHYPRSVE